MVICHITGYSLSIALSTSIPEMTIAMVQFELESIPTNLKDQIQNGSEIKFLRSTLKITDKKKVQKSQRCIFSKPKNYMSECTNSDTYQRLDSINSNRQQNMRSKKKMS